MRALCWTVLVVACGSTTPNVRPTPLPVPKATGTAKPDSESLALRTEEVAIEQWSEFVSPSLGTLPGLEMPEAELEKRLPAAARAEYRAVRQAREKYAALKEEATFAHGDRDKASAAAERAQEALAAAHDRALQTLKTLFAQSKSGAVAIALTRARERGTDRFEGLEGVRAIYAATELGPEHAPGLEALEQAMRATGLDAVGRWVRLELVRQLMRTPRAREAHAILDELLPASPPDLRAHLLFRKGLLQALDFADAKAADTFRSARDGLAPSSQLSPRMLLTAEILARSRAQQLDRVLRLVREGWEELTASTPSAPAVFDVAFLQLAADAVEWLGIDPGALEGPAGLRAGIASVLAARALYRHDDAAARSWATIARQIGGGLAHDALCVLYVLARRAGADQQAQVIQAELEALESGSQLRSLEQRALRAEMLEQVGYRDTQKTAEPAPPVERNVRSLMRLCLQPVHDRLPREGVEAITLRASVYPRHRVEVRSEATPAARGRSALAVLTNCIQELGPRVLSAAPSSVQARVSLAKLAESP